MYFIEKPDSISWDKVQKCQHDAQATNLNEQGFEMACMYLSGTELQQRCQEGKMFIALDGNKVVGTGAITIRNLSKFGKRIKTAYLAFDSVHPNFRGKGLYHKIQNLRTLYAIDNNVDLIYLETHEKNERMKHIYKKYGYHLFLLRSYESTNYYTVVLAISPKHPRLFSFAANIFYWISYIYTKLRYKPGRIKRFL